MNKNTIGFGILISCILPIIGYLIWIIINFILLKANVVDKLGNTFQFSQKTVLLTSVCLNLIPFHMAMNRRWDYMLRGVGLLTLGLLFAWAFYFDVFNL